MRRLVFTLALLGSAALSGSVADASELNISTASSTPYELRISGFAHGVILGNMKESGSADIGGTLVFPIFETKLDGTSSIFIPRAHLGTTLSLASETSFVYAGLTWKAPIVDQYFVTFDFGGALNNGDELGGPDRAAMGCQATFRESLGLGRQLNNVWSVAASIEHFSNAGLCEGNEGITNIGLTVGYDF